MSTNVYQKFFQVEYKSKRMAATRLGLCSNYLNRLQEGDLVLVKTRPGTFRYYYFATVDQLNMHN